MVQMRKILALDYGDRWTGIAISDATGTLARPHSSVSSTDLIPYLKDLVTQESIETIIIGIPITMKGGDSTQTRATRECMANLAKEFPDITMVGWDERLSSKRAQSLGASKNSATGKDSEHARAAAFILDSYLTYRSFQAQLDDE
jgi:putative holliday junction resolvase